MSTDQLAQAMAQIEVSEVSASALRVHISNLAWATTSQGLADFFGSKGLQVVKAEVMADYNGRSKGWGLAEFQNAADADFAIQESNDAEVDGRVIHVRADRGPGRQDEGDRPPRAFKAAAAPAAPVSSSSVHISNLAWATTSESLTAFFGSKGIQVVKCEVMADYNGRSKGWGLAEFQNAADADFAIQESNDADVDGRVIHVRADRGPGRPDDGDRPPRGGGGGGGGAARKPRAAGGKKTRRSKEDAKGCRVFVSNLSWQTDWQGLKEHFRQAGEVLYANVLMDYETERSKGCGVVEFSTPEEAQSAIATLSEQDLDGRNIVVRVDREPGDRQNNSEGGGY